MIYDLVRPTGRHFPECLVINKTKLFDCACLVLTARPIYCTKCGHRKIFRLSPYFFMSCYVVLSQCHLGISESVQTILGLYYRAGRPLL